MENLNESIYKQYKTDTTKAKGKLEKEIKECLKYCISTVVDNFEKYQIQESIIKSKLK